MSFFSSKTVLNVCAFGFSVYHGYSALRECTVQVSDDHHKVNPSLTQRVKGLTQVVKLIAEDHVSEPSAVGVNMKLLRNNAAIRVNKAMLELVPEGMNYFILRELFKIKQNTTYANSCIRTFATGVGAVFGIAISNSAGFAGRSTVLLLAEVAAGFFCSRNEESAINFALKAANEKELLGALHIFEAVKRAAKRSESSIEEIDIQKQLVKLKAPYSLNENVVDKLAKRLKPSCLTRYGLKFAW
ncbi:MAG: hypothetical protein JSR37_08825 [Verrucomicrobia bacterium]|nr:hypothetical protein [Verrucomicrobiota bacterium]MBS0637213.1 hypothetical protein [Verrucomicrobiota bacterium]